MKPHSFTTLRTLFPGKRAAALVAVAAALAITPTASAQLVIADNFNVTGGNSPSTGFGTDGVNFEIGSRLSGSAFDANPGMSLLRTNTGKALTAYSITGNQLVVADATGVGAFQYSADGLTQFDFGTHLAGQTYEINLTMTLGDLESGRRMSFLVAAAPGANATNTNLGFQVATNATSGGTMSVFQRLDSTANSTGVDINAEVASGLAFNTQIEMRLVITDSTDYTPGVFASTYELFVNDVSAVTGSFRFADSERYLIFDIAPNAGPASYDNFSVTVVPEPSTVALGMLAFLVGLVVHRLRRLPAKKAIC